MKILPFEKRRFWGDQLEVQAALQYQSAATELLVTVLNVARTVRPKCHWGYWANTGLCADKRPCKRPDHPEEDWKCEIEHPIEGERLWAIAQQQKPIWEASDALFPEIYFESPNEDAGLGGKSAGFGDFHENRKIPTEKR